MYSFLRLFLYFPPWLLLLLSIFINSHSSFAMPRLARLEPGIIKSSSSPSSSSSRPSADVKVLYYSQILDHFNYQPESYTTFKQKYMVYSKYWGGAKNNSPILVYLGDEQPMADDEIDSLILTDYAAQLKALVVIIEHRFYGKSKPFGMTTMDEVVKNVSARGYFSSAQAIADFAEVILYLKKHYKADYSPVIVVGGSYGGLLAAWFRLKYPHIAIGALASSAPVLYFDNIISPNRGYYYIVNKDFKEASENCFNTIKSSWKIIDEIGSKPDGLRLLSEKFKTCAQLNNTEELKNFLENFYDVQAQYRRPALICNAIDKQGNTSTDVLSRIFAGVTAYFGNRTCYNTNSWDTGETVVGYAWQTCSEMVMPVVRGTSKDSMFPPETFNLRSFIQGCKAKYGVLPRPHWITTYYGGHDMKLVLERFGSNIIFSNGLKDPYSSAGVLEDLTNSIVSVYTINGTHCMDIGSARKDDPEWLVNQRKREVDIINGWIKQYYVDLENYLKSLSSTNRHSLINLN